MNLLDEDANPIVDLESSVEDDGSILSIETYNTVPGSSSNKWPHKIDGNEIVRPIPIYAEVKKERKCPPPESATTALSPKASFNMADFMAHNGLDAAQFGLDGSRSTFSVEEFNAVNGVLNSLMAAEEISKLDNDHGDGGKSAASADLDSLRSGLTSIRSSFSIADFKARGGVLDLARLLDPFEKLEREFVNSTGPEPIFRPPSAFGSISGGDAAMRSSSDGERSETSPPLSGPQCSDESSSLNEIATSTDDSDLDNSESVIVDKGFQFRSCKKEASKR